MAADLRRWNHCVHGIREVVPGDTARKHGHNFSIAKSCAGIVERI